MTLPGVEGETEGKRDTPNDQVMEAIMSDQQTMPADAAQTASQATTGMPLTTTQSTPAIADPTMTAIGSDQPTFQATNRCRTRDHAKCTNFPTPR